MHESKAGSVVGMSRFIATGPNLVTYLPTRHLRHAIIVELSLLSSIHFVRFVGRGVAGGLGIAAHALHRLSDEEVHTVRILLRALEEVSATQLDLVGRHSEHPLDMGFDSLHVGLPFSAAAFAIVASFRYPGL